jgi:putative PIN family toxin of toxin-antitoxin system
MRVVLDTNILISALLNQASLAAQLITLWRQGRFDVLTAGEQLDELARVTRYPKIRVRIPPPLAGRLVNQLRELTVMVEKLPSIDRARDPYDNYLLAIAAAGGADYLITGDKRDLLSLKRHERTSIVSVRQFLAVTKLEAP